MITVTLDDVRATLTMRADGWMHGARVASLPGICLTEMKFSNDPFRYLVLCK